MDTSFVCIDCDNARDTFLILYENICTQTGIKLSAIYLLLPQTVIYK